MWFKKYGLMVRLIVLLRSVFESTATVIPVGTRVAVNMISQRWVYNKQKDAPLIGIDWLT